jgi:hypothetical protein
MLLRTDTTLDLSQKARVVKNNESWGLAYIPWRANDEVIEGT